MNNGVLREALPAFYLGVAYSHIPTEGERAIEAFKEGFEVFDKSYNQGIHLNELWARSHFARVLREKGRIEEAKQQELQTRSVIHVHSLLNARLFTTQHEQSVDCWKLGVLRSKHIQEKYRGTVGHRGAHNGPRGRAGRVQPDRRD